MNCTEQPTYQEMSYASYRDLPLLRQGQDYEDFGCKPRRKTTNDG